MEYAGTATAIYRNIVSVVDEHTASTVTARYAMALAAARGDGRSTAQTKSGRRP